MTSSIAHDVSKLLSGYLYPACKQDPSSNWKLAAYGKLYHWAQIHSYVVPESLSYLFSEPHASHSDILQTLLFLKYLPMQETCCLALKGN